jgi:hypothetical protein
MAERKNELEKTKTRPKKEGDNEPVIGEAPGGDPSKKTDDLLEEAKKIQEELDKTREKVRQREQQIEEDATEIRQKHKIKGGE